MSDRRDKPAFDLFTVDELDVSIKARAAQSDILAHAIEDANALQALLDELVRLRKQSGLTQTDIALLMGVRQPTVSQFERESSDPRISTLHRYARAVGSQVAWRVVSWTDEFNAHGGYAAQSPGRSPRPDEVTVSRKPLPQDWAAESNRADFMLAA